MIRKPKRSNPRESNAYKEMCYRVRKRDKNTCQMPDCGSKKNIQVHHIRRFADNGHGRLNVLNCICICKTHHEQTLKNREDIYAPLLLKIAARNDKEERERNERKD